MFTKRGIEHFPHDFIKEFELISTELICSYPLRCLIACDHVNNPLHHFPIFFHNIPCSQETKSIHFQHLFLYFIYTISKWLEVVLVRWSLLPVLGFESDKHLADVKRLCKSAMVSQECAHLFHMLDVSVFECLVTEIRNKLAFNLV